ncbi:MAG: type IV pilus modification PilV family protein [Gaiellaceae bacterium]
MRSEQGFGLVELLIAMVVLNVGLLATVAAFTSGTFAINRASNTATAATLADSQMEIYRGLTYDWITLTASPSPALDTTYTTDAAYTSCSTGSTPSCTHLTDAFMSSKCTGSGAVAVAFAAACKPIQIVAGPDGHSYRIDTFIGDVAGTTTAPAQRRHKDIVVVVRDARTLRVLARQESIFDCATAATGSNCPTS